MASQKDIKSPVEGWTVSGSDFLKPLSEIVYRYLDGGSDRVQPVVKLASPAELAAAFDKAGVPLRLADAVQPVTNQKLLSACQIIVDYSVHTNHPHFLNQLYGHCDPVSIGGDWLAAALNTNVHTYEVAPVFTVMERAVIEKFARVIGPEFAKHHEGLFVPGCSIANMYGMLLARFLVDPDVRTRGMAGGPTLVAFVSDQAHYSYQKSAMLMGLGLDNIVPVKSDILGAMLPGELEVKVAEARAAGKLPFFVGATAGSTVTGAFDDFNKLADICAKENMWLHADGAWGGCVLLSSKHRVTMCAGIERIDSFAFDAHKLMAMPVQCSGVLVRHANMLKACNGMNAVCLFQPDKLNCEQDIGDMTIQCGRRNDCLKLWMAWHALGDSGFEERVDRSAALCQYWAQKVEGDPRFKMAVPLVLLNVCFWYIPTDMRNFDPSKCTPEEHAKLHKIAPLIKARMQKEGLAMIGFQPFKGMPNAFRAVLPGAAILSTQDVDSILETIARLGEEIESQNKLQSVV